MAWSWIHGDDNYKPKYCPTLYQLACATYNPCNDKHEVHTFKRFFGQAERDTEYFKSKIDLTNTQLVLEQRKTPWGQDIWEGMVNHT
jgi:hypothetical protein